MGVKGTATIKVLAAVLASVIGLGSLLSFASSPSDPNSLSSWRALAPSDSGGSDDTPDPNAFVVPANYTKSDSCVFTGCPAWTEEGVRDGHRFIYIYTGFRNRGKSYNRFIRTLVRDVMSGERGFIDPRCVCPAVANYNDVVTGPPIDAALEDWPFDSQFINLSGGFSLAGGFTEVLQQIVKTPEQNSVVLKMDADMVVFPGFLNNAMEDVHRGKQAYAPGCWSQKINKKTQEEEGYWRTGGSGIIAFVIEDFKRINKGSLVVPLSGKTEHGRDDHELTELLHHSEDSYHVHRRCDERLIHMDHPHHKWMSSADGISSGMGLGSAFRKDRVWRMPLPGLDEPEKLRKQGLLDHSRCKEFATRLYPH